MCGVGKNLLLIFGVETFSAFASTVALPDFADSSLAALADPGMDILALPDFANAVSEHNEQNHES